MASRETAIGRMVNQGERLPGNGSAAVNVGRVERYASAGVGGLLALWGLRRGGVGGALLAALGGGLLYRGVTGHCDLYQALGVNTDQPGSEPATSIPAGHGVKVEESVTVNRPVGEVYRFWRNLENLPRFMDNLESVKVEGNRSHWVAKAPLGASVSWDAEIINEKPDELIAWRSLEGSTVSTAGSVHFTPAQGGRATEVRVNLKYDPPLGKAGVAVARLFSEHPARQIRDDLRRFKQIMESGGVPAEAGQSRGR